jgi:hypothetical protein
MPINWLTVGSLYGAAGVAFGAFGAHGLKSRGISDAKIASWGTASHYQVSSKGHEQGSGKKGCPQKIHILSSRRPLAIFSQRKKNPPLHGGECINPSIHENKSSNLQIPHP